MAEAIARTWLVILASYLGVGVLIALAFATRGVDRVDAAARGATLGFRLVIVPGAIAFWPLLLRRWLRGDSTPPEERNAHREAAR